MRGHVTALLVQFEKHRDAGNLRRLLVTLPRHYARALVYTLRYHPEPWQRSLRSEIGGCLCGFAYYLSRVADRVVDNPTHPRDGGISG